MNGPTNPPPIFAFATPLIITYFTISLGIKLQGGLELSPQLFAVVALFALVVLGATLRLRNQFAAETPTHDDPPQQAADFLTDREYICQLIAENGGRMKQSAIVAEVDWSKAKVSRLLADLEDEEELTKLRLGRENLVCLSGHEPTASQSPEQSKGE